MPLLLQPICWGKPGEATWPLTPCVSKPNPATTPSFSSLHPPFFFFKLFICNWRIIALQYCVGFCHTSAWIRHRYTHAPSILNLPATSHPHPTPPGCHRALVWVPWVIQQIPTGYFTCGSVYASMLISPFVPPSPSPTHCVHKSVLYVCVSIAALQIGSSLSSF